MCQGSLRSPSQRRTGRCEGPSSTHSDGPDWWLSRGKEVMVVISGLWRLWQKAKWRTFSFLLKYIARGCYTERDFVLLPIVLVITLSLHIH